MSGGATGRKCGSADVEIRDGLGGGWPILVFKAVVIAEGLRAPNGRCLVKRYLYRSMSSLDIFVAIHNSIFRRGPGGLR